ncbi:MAG TPA: STN domain-containing protein, partial [Prolixibacteraceae bacterium]|nr:STN domain-containing protein [Prolixibacteraceae bacterium]
MKLLLTKLPGRQAGPLKNLYRVMKLTWLLVLTLCLQTSASVWSQTSSLSLKLNNTTLQELFNTIENKTGYRFFYNNDEVDVSQKVTLSINDKTVGDILTQAFKDLPYSFKELDNKLILIERTENKSENTGLQQQKTINGKVNDPKGLPLPGVTVLV